jgi:hypothetical protein
MPSPAEIAAARAEIEADPVQVADRAAGRMPIAYRRMIAAKLVDELSQTEVTLADIDRARRVLLHPGAGAHWMAAIELACNFDLSTEQALAVLDAMMTSPEQTGGALKN